MAESRPEDSETDPQRTRVRPPDEAPPEPTVVGGHRRPEAPRRRLSHRLIVAVALLIGLALALWWQRTAEVQAPSAPSTAPEAPIGGPKPGATVVQDGSLNAFQRRLLALAGESGPALADSERQQRLTLLFEQFSAALAAGRLALPAIDSASEYLLRMTVLDDQDPRVLEARSRLTQAFLERSRAARQAGDWQQADLWLQSALDIRLVVPVEPPSTTP